MKVFAIEVTVTHISLQKQSGRVEIGKRIFYDFFPQTLKNLFQFI